MPYKEKSLWGFVLLDKKSDYLLIYRLLAQN